MPLKLNVGASRKVTDHNYGSRGASVNLEIELDSSLIADPAKLHARIRQLFGLVGASLAEELNSSRSNSDPAKGSETAPPARATTSKNGTGGERGGTPPATTAQINALYAITRERGLDLSEVLQQHCRVQRPEDLTIRQASAVIDALKSSPERNGD